MKHPFWIINLGLLSLVLAIFAFIYLSTVKISQPKIEDLETEEIAPFKEQKVAINIKKIYEEDLFGTYVKEIVPMRPEIVIPFPTPPAQQTITIPPLIEPEFLDPLQITLKGIVVVSSNDSKNRAMIQDNKTTQEGTYKVGDFVQDAQLTRIFKNKVIFLRLNGQQEVLYLREQDAKTDPVYNIAHDWDTVIKKTGNNTYLVNPQSFVEQVRNLTNCIDLLNATTAYQQGKSVGLRIGAGKSPLASLMGLQNGDIILSINNIPAQTTQERLAIYKNITSLTIGNTITVKLVRKNREMTLMYMLEDFALKEEESMSTQEKQETAFLFSRKNDNIKQQHYAFAPTLDKMKKADHHMILHKGGISA